MATKSYLYETHLHTAPVSRCARASVRESLEFYKELGYEGVFITNHFIDGNIGCDRNLPYEERIEFYFLPTRKDCTSERKSEFRYFRALKARMRARIFLSTGLTRNGF